MKGELEKILAKKKQKEENERKMKVQKLQAAKAACHCLSTASGKEFLGWLLRECGFHQPSVVYNAESGEIRLQATAYNEAKRDVYLRVRNLLASRPDILAEVENNIKGESNV